MELKLIDVVGEQHEVEFGTCELCMSTGMVDEPTFVFEIDGKRIEIDGYQWDWGDYHELCVDNVVQFSAWLSTQDFVGYTEKDFGYYWLEEKISEYDKQEKLFNENQEMKQELKLIKEDMKIIKSETYGFEFRKERIRQICEKWLASTTNKKIH